MSTNFARLTTNADARSVCLRGGGRGGKGKGERRGGEGKGKDRSSMASQSPDKTSKCDLLTYLNLIFSISD